MLTWLPEVYRKTQRNAKCSGCYKTIPRNQGEVVLFLGKKETIVICDFCLDQINVHVMNGRAKRDHDRNWADEQYSEDTGT